MFTHREEVSPEVSSEEIIGRFINQRSYYRPSEGTVKHNAFMPASNGELSVYRISNLINEQVWAIGDEFVANRGRNILGHAKVLASCITTEGLLILSKPKPHPLHADVVNWPESKSEQKLKAMLLAANASLKLRP